MVHLARIFLETDRPLALGRSYLFISGSFAAILYVGTYEHHFLMNAPEVSEQQLSKHNRQDGDRATTSAGRR